MTEFDLFQALRPLYPAREYALLPQAASGTGTAANRHCDALAMSLWPSRGLTLSGFEIKCYRGDWMRELHNPEKAEKIAGFCNYWWIVASGSFVEEAELPRGWGLLEWSVEKAALVKKRAAPYRKANRPDLSFVAAMLRKAQDVLTPDAALAAARADGKAEGAKQASGEAEWELQELRQLKVRVAEFEKASGVKIDKTWEDGRRIGEAVQEVLNGNAMRRREELVNLSRRILQEIGEPAINPESSSSPLLRRARRRVTG